MRRRSSTLELASFFDLLKLDIQPLDFLKHLRQALPHPILLLAHLHRVNLLLCRDGVCLLYAFKGFDSNFGF